MTELEKEPKSLSKKQLIRYYVDLLTYVKKDNHRRYINHMIGYHSGLMPYPDAEITNRLK